MQKYPTATHPPNVDRPSDVSSESAGASTRIPDPKARAFRQAPFALSCSRARAVPFASVGRAFATRPQPRRVDWPHDYEVAAVPALARESAEKTATFCSTSSCPVNYSSCKAA